jgi:hypothetical protein
MQSFIDVVKIEKKLMIIINPNNNISALDTTSFN